MKRNPLLYLVLIGLISLLAGCEKDGTKVTMIGSPVVPTIKTMPSLTLVRAQGNNVIKFVGTPVDPGFEASATYFLEACAHGNNFANVATVYSGVQDTAISLKIVDLNGILLKVFAGDVATSADFRIRSVLVVDAGTSAPGTSTKPFEYTSAVTTVNVTPYGLPRLDLLNSGVTQKVESALGDGNSLGYVFLDVTKPFTLKDPDANITYGGDGTSLLVNGTAIVPLGAGWHKLTANTNNKTYTLKLFNIGLIGSATPNGWSAPDSKMTYNPQSGLWAITLNLVVGEVKFRMNDSWNDGINLGIGDATHPEYTINNLWNSGSSQNIPISAAGNYTVKLNIGASTYSCTITKNN